MVKRGCSDGLTEVGALARPTGQARRLAVFVLAVIGLTFIGRSTVAEFEIPLIDTTNAPAQPEFRAVWAFNRGFTNYSGVKYNRYEAYAVGIDKSIAEPDANGVFYFFDGTRWSRVTAPFADSAPVYSLNAVVGQEDHGDGNPSPMFVVGSKSRIGIIWGYYNTLGSPATLNFPSSGDHHIGQFEADVVSNNPNPNRDFYAIDAAQSYGRPLLAGGERGLIAVAYNKGGNPGSPWKVVDPDGRLEDPSNETITAIRFSNLNTAYVVTSTFTANGGKLDRDCGGNQTSRLYKVDLSDPDNSTWTLAASSNNKCFFSLAISQRDDPAIHTPLKNVIWIAASDGVWKYDESNATAGLQSTNVVSPTYAITAIPDRGGNGQNLLMNGGFESLLQGSFNPSPGPEVNPDGWLIQDQGIGTNNETGNCGTNSKDIVVTSKDVDPAAVHSGQYAVKIDTGVRYDNVNNCVFDTTPHYDFTTGVIQRVPLSTIEGQKFKVSGWYKVVFSGKPNAAKAQGGVVVGCSGNSNNYEANFINCSVSNRSLVRTPANPAVNWEPFSLTLSREDLIFDGDIEKNKGRLTPRAMYLEVRCEATYGATVFCDDLKVEEVSDPPILARDTYTVIAAGADIASSGIMVNVDALGAGQFTSESLPNKVRSDAAADPSILNDVNALTAVDLQHVFAVGQGKSLGATTTGVTLLGRTPSTLAGTIWVGVSSPTGPTTNAALGSISVSCVNNRDAAGATLCQRSPESYGISLERHPILPTDTTLVGSLTGRAWFGKASVGSDDMERLDLGSCQRSPWDPNNIPAQPYNLAGRCDAAQRRCKAPDNTPTSFSCLSDFDCFGRCARDEGFLCVKDDDCRIGPETFSSPLSPATANLSKLPGSELVCGEGSPLACTPVGWLSFNKSDFSATQQIAPDGSSIGVNYNILFADHNQGYPDLNQGGHELSGWGRFMTPANPSNPNSQDTGWVRLRGSSTGQSTSGKLFACRDCIGALGQMNCAFCQDESNQSCTPADTATTANCHYLCEDNTTPCVTNDQCSGIGSGQCKAPGFCTGDGTTPCASDATCASVGGRCAIGAICERAGSQCTKYGVNLDTETGKFYGYAWSQDFGWLSFQNVTQGGGRIIQTRLADIYAQGPIGAAGIPTPMDPNNCNGTYLIISSSAITNFCSALGTSAVSGVDPVQPGSSTIPFPGAGNIYQNILGRFDLKGIETITKTDDAGRNYNKYGSEIVTANQPASSDLTDSSNESFLSRLNANGKALGGKVYIASGQTDYTIEQVLTIENSSDLGTEGSGAGILIVNGNLTINNQTTYTSAAITDLRKLASLVVVIKGNLTIANAVQNLVGAYYVYDNPATPVVEGTIDTHSSDSDNQYPLTVHGLMIAKKFEFKRNFAGTIENPLPSELIIYDGRLQSNPLPGMTDFVNALPSTVNPGP